MKTFAALLCLLLLAGCAAFPGDELSSQPFRAPLSEQPQRPKVLVEFNFYRGTVEDAKDATSIAVARDMVDHDMVGEIRAAIANA